MVRRGKKLEENYIGVDRVYSDKECSKILAFNNYIKNSEITKEYYSKVKDKNDIIKMQMIDINFWLANDILQKADRMSMANSLEVRVPFIDIEVFKVANQMTTDKKITKENTKVALRDAARKSIPNESYKKKKLGFPVPLREWMKDEDVYEEIKSTLEQDFVKEFFNQNYALKLLDRVKNGKTPHFKKVWILYTYIKWYETFFLEEKNNES